MKPAAWLCFVLAAPAFAQTTPAIDGKVSLTGRAAEHLYLEGAKGITTIYDVRYLMASILEDRKFADDERELLSELAAGQAVAVTAGARRVTVPAMPERLLQWPKTMLSPPNLHQLWHAPGAPSEVLVEMAQWGPVMNQRIVAFIGNQLDDAWKKSTLINQFEPYSMALQGLWKALETLPAGRETRQFAHDLISVSVLYGIEKAKAEGREPPKDFLYVWVETPEIEAKFVDGKPPAPPT